jgi:hypothetical protein
VFLPPFLTLGLGLRVELVAFLRITGLDKFIFGSAITVGNFGLGTPLVIVNRLTGPTDFL